MHERDDTDAPTRSQAAPRFRDFAIGSRQSARLQSHSTSFEHRVPNANDGDGVHAGHDADNQHRDTVEGIDARKKLADLHRLPHGSP